ncbi:MAG: glutamine--tRNA ligase/YqeY domain fusion protein [Thermoanaerobaculia bacterium]
MSDSANTDTKDFVRSMVERDLESGRVDRVATRFPPEPNGHLHIGHAKAICLDFGLAREYGGTCNLRFDDTNPETEDMAFVEAIQRDVRWLGFEWDGLCFASDYFERLWGYALELARAGKAYVDESSDEEIRAHRGTITEPGRPTAGRDRPIEENLELMERMRAGEFPDASMVVRARIDLAHPNMKMRDPVLYRVLHRSHYRTGDDWCVYPLYDHAHCLSDSIEGITHSLCTLEFENNRAIYDWILDNVDVPRPRPEQTEFARLNLTYTVLSKRKLAQLVAAGHVEGWGDPRMPTLWGLRRRGYTPEAIRAFCDAVGVAKANSVVDVAMLEHAVRDDLNHRAPRVLCVLDPLKVTITNFPEGEEDVLEGDYWPRDIPKEGTRPLPFSRELWIERSDFMEDPPGKFYRLAPGREVRLRYGYFIRCEEVVKGENGEVVELRCTYDPATRGGQAPDGRKVKGTIHWVSAAHALPVEVRLYDRLFADERPGADGADFLESLNPDSLEVAAAWIEPSVAGAEPGERYQFERHGYFYLDPEAQTGDRPVFHRTVPLRDSWTRRSG